jgi:hypothetical protein
VRNPTSKPTSPGAARRELAYDTCVYVLKLFIKMKSQFEKADFLLRLFTFIALVAGGAWAFYLYHLSGSDDWGINISLETKVLPYHDKLRLLVVHVKSKNPRKVNVELRSKLGDSYTLSVRKLPADAKAETVFEEDQGDLINKIDLMKSAEGDYEILPGAEMDDMRVFVLPINTTVSLYADMEMHNGREEKNGKPDTDFEGASTVVRIEP